MRFGPVALDDAEGAVLAHSVRLPGWGRVAKGTVLERSHLDALRTRGVESVVVARLEAGDVSEDEAASAIADALAGSGVRVGRAATGRCNLTASYAGLLEIDAEAIHRVNGVHESLTAATASPGTPVEAGGLVATVKIIPFAVPGRALEECRAAARNALRVAPFQTLDVTLVQTRVEGTTDEALDRAERLLGERVGGRGSRLVRTLRCGHDAAALADVLDSVLDDEEADVLLVLGGSATVDRRDIVPTAIEDVGGEVLHFGLPLDPGNLTLLALADGVPVLGVPGCARSPRRNGFDAVLDRVLTGHLPTSHEIASWGLGGLLREDRGRPHPRLSEDVALPVERGHVAGLLLAAGRSQRMGEVNKLLVEVDGQPLVRRAAKALLEGGVDSLHVVLGHEGERVREVLSGLEVTFVDNPDWREGMGTSVARGIAELPGRAEAALVALGDMPWVAPSDVAALIDGFHPANGCSVCVPVHEGKRGNPVLWGRRWFAHLRTLEGDVGARRLLVDAADEVCEIDVGSDGVLLDVDTPDALDRRPTG